MALRDDNIVKVFTANATGTLEKNGFTASDLEECNALVREYASKKDPMSRFQISEITNFVVDNLMQQTEDFLTKIGDVKNVGEGDKAQFAVGQNDVEAYIQAKGGTPLRTKIVNNYVTIDTVEVAARPYMNFQDLATGRLNFTDMAVSATREMTYKKMAYIENILRNAVKGIGSGAYTAVSDLNNAKTINSILANFRRHAPAGTRIIGDVGVLDSFDWVVKNDYAGATGIIENIINNGTIGKYKGCDVVAYENPTVDAKLTPLLSTKMIYLLAGAVSPLKIVNEGGVRTMEATNIDDESMEMVIRQNFGAGFVVGKYTNLGAVEITG